jgi:putative ABC transport system permease protein
MSPTLFGLRLGVLGRFYRWRIREHGMQELLALAGIAVGVALVFGVLVANTSLIGSAQQLVHGIEGSARVQLAARSPAGFDERVALRAARLPGVRRAALLLRGSAAVLGPDGTHRTIQLVGVTEGLAALGGSLTQDFRPGGMRLSRGLTLPSEIVAAIGARRGRNVTLLADGRAWRVRVGSVLGSAAIGSLAHSPLGIAQLPVAQRLLGRQGRVTQLLVQPRPGADRRVARELRAIAAGRLSVLPTGQELRLLDLAARPNDQSTGLFAAISAMVGILLALNAMLLTVPERRRFVAELRTQGFDPRQVLLILAFEALLLGTVASVAGLALGDLLSRTLFGRVPAYLAFAFPIGTQRVVHESTVLLAFGGGLLATVVASLPPALDLRSSQPLDAILRESGGEAGQGMRGLTARALLLAGLATIAFSTLLALLVPALTLVAGVALALATLCLIPAAFAGTARVLGRVSRRLRGSMLPIAVMELRATTTRSIALAGIGALAVYGSVAIEGAHHDLVRGLDANFGQFLATADLWVTTGGDDLTTNSFHADGLAARVARAPGVAAVRTYRGGLLDDGDRRLWIIGRSPADRAPIPSSQLLHGDLASATARIRRGGWAAISEVVAKSRGLEIGDRFTLPTPSGTTPLRVAAITTNLGWPPGGVILNARDFRRGWGSADPAALQVDLDPGIAPAAGKRAVERALGPAAPGLRVQTLAERRAQYAALSRQGLTSLTQISTLLLIAAAIAVASALSAAIWQRRIRLAALKIQGFDRWQLWRSLLLEGAIVLAIGCAVGAVLGVYGHALASRYLELTTGFPAPFSVALPQIVATLALVASIAMLVVALPGWIAAQVAPRASFQE